MFSWLQEEAVRLWTLKWSHPRTKNMSSLEPTETIRCVVFPTRNTHPFTAFKQRAEGWLVGTDMRQEYNLIDINMVQSYLIILDLICKQTHFNGI